MANLKFDFIYFVSKEPAYSPWEWLQFADKEEG